MPAESAVLVQYDPWIDFTQNVGKYRTVEQPYLPVLELGRRLEEIDHAARSSWVPGGPIEKLVVPWSTSHGLLGLLPSLAESIAFPVTSGDTPYQRVWFRLGGQWWEKDSESEPFREPGIDWSRSFEGGFKERGGFDLLLKFFPKLAERKSWFDDVPQIQTTEFWRDYGEPLELFDQVCIELAQAVRALGSWQWTSEAADQRGDALWFLNSLVQAAGPTFGDHDPSGKPGIFEYHICAGLLGSYALMILSDLTSGRRIPNCETCGRFFVSNVAQAAYCSPKCRHTAQTRRHRQKSRTV